MVFGASSLYLVLKVGLTVSASIPVAVISITVFRILSKIGLRDATILENNIVQTAGSAGESIAFGVGVTMPAIMILGFDLEVSRVMLVAVLGGLLGILMMIPLRRALIVKQHGVLKYPEGTACAEVLKAGAMSAAASGSGSGAGAAGGYHGAHTIFTGFGIGLVYKAAMAALRGWKDVPEKVFGAPFKGGSVSAEISPELLGVGYIIGPRISLIMCGGGVLAYLVLIPLIKFFGDSLSAPLPPGSIPIRDMTPNEVRGAYLLYIGAGAVAASGIINVFRSVPIIWHSIKEGWSMVNVRSEAGGTVRRTDRDLSFKFVFGGIVALILAITFSPPLHMNLLGAGLIVICGFLFVTVSSRITGEIGSSSNPISGMTVATLLMTCLIFLIVGWTAPAYYITALSVGGIVCVSAANAGTTSQDLKTGFLVGATPRLQQIAILVGAFASALILGPILMELNKVATIYVPQVTYEPFESKGLSIPAALYAQLPAHQTDSATPIGSFRLLNTASVPSQAGYTNLSAGEYLVAESGKVAWRLRRNFPAGLRAPKGELIRQENLRGPQGAVDPKAYWVWQNKDSDLARPGKYLVNGGGVPVYYVDPGVNGVYTVRPDGTTVTKFGAPQATLVSYIIKGILSRKLPWALVLLGVMIAVVLEMLGLPSLAFSVGVYLPLSSSMPVFCGGMIRLVVDGYLRQKHAGAGLTPEQLAAEADKSAGVLLASGYIAGGAIAGILIAFMAGVLAKAMDWITEWSEQHNPFFSSRSWNMSETLGCSRADVLALIPFAVLCLILYLVGREVLLAKRRTA
jgi:putative OPT family oligopeptide transporter